MRYIDDILDAKLVVPVRFESWIVCDSFVSEDPIIRTAPELVDAAYKNQRRSCYWTY
jgi:hypothetical protein